MMGEGPMVRRERLVDSIEFHTHAALARMKELERLDSIPEEPDNDPAILYFEKRFANGGTDRRVKAYTYVAVKAGDGKWYTSGPRSPKGYTWEELWEFLSTGVDEVWLVSELIPLEGSS
jgi:hypothetical protein